MTEITWKQIRDRARTTGQKLSLDLAVLYLDPNPYHKFIELVQRGMVWTTREMARNKNIVDGMSEDQLTMLLLAPLTGAGFAAYHDVNVGGHCDIYVEYDDELIWLAEAKIHSSYGYLYKGFCQLADRYSTGLAGQDEGGLVIYIFNDNAKAVMEAWLKYLGGNCPTIKVEFDSETLVGRTEHLHSGSGRLMKISHFPTVLHHKPSDTLPTPKRDQ